MSLGGRPRRTLDIPHLLWDREGVSSCYIRGKGARAGPIIKEGFSAKCTSVLEEGGVIINIRVKEVRTLVERAYSVHIDIKGEGVYTSVL